MRHESCRLGERAYKNIIEVFGPIVPTLEELIEREREAREVRAREADWEFIKSQPPRLRIALEFYVETGDLYVAAKIAGLTVEEFNELRMKARIPHVN